MRIRYWLLLGVACSYAATPVRADPVPGLPFSADIVTRDAAGVAVNTAGKLYVSAGKVRMEMPEMASGFFLIDSEASSALFVTPIRRMVVDARQSNPLTRVFVPVNPDDPCPQWQAAAKSAGALNTHWQCRPRSEPAARRQPVIEYQVIVTDRSAGERWIDRELAFPVKLRRADGSSVALENVRIGVQPAALFELPPDYRKLDPQALIEQIKHSDVWAAPSQ
jgi:hypothetical protein